MNENLHEAGKFLSILYRRRWLCIAVTFAVTVAILLAGVALPRRYRADSTVFIEENIIKNLVKGIAVTSDVENDVRVLKYAMLSRNLINRVLSRIDPNLINKGRPVDAKYVQDLQERTDISIKGKDLFTVSITDSDPRFAKDFINGLVRSYVEENIFTQREQTYGAERFLGEQLRLFKQKLDDAENAIIEFRKQQGTYLALSDKSLLEDLKRLGTDAEALSMGMETLAAQRKVLEEQLKSVDQSMPIMSGKNAESRLVSLQQRLAMLKGTYTENYPEIVQLRAMIEEEEKRLMSPPEKRQDAGGGEVFAYNPVFVEVKQRLLAVEAEMSSRKSQRDRILSMIRQKEALLREAPESQKKLNLLEQERDSARGIYQELLTRTGQAEVGKQMEIGDKTVNFRVVDPAIVAEKPVWPNPVVVILLAVALGLMAGGGAAFIADGLNATVNSLGDLADLGADVLAVIPVLPMLGGAKSTTSGNVALVSTAGMYLLMVAGLLTWAWLWMYPTTSLWP